MKRAVLAALLAGTIATAGDATLITKKISFTASDFHPGFSFTPPPTTLVAGAFTVTFDPTVDQTGNTTDITGGTPDRTLGSTLGFNYATGNHQLSIGGLTMGAGGIVSSSNDYVLIIKNIGGGSPPITGLFAYSDLVTHENFSAGNLQITVADAPEPQSWALMIAGFSVVGAAMRARRRVGLTYGAAAFA